MVHTDARELAFARGFYTGESYSAARAALKSYFESSKFPIPAAASSTQMLLEAEVLASLAGLPGEEKWWPDRYPLLVKAASPSPGGLSLLVPRDCLMLFCRQIQPTIEDATGTAFDPGSGIKAIRGAGEVSLVRDDAAITLPGILWNAWLRSLAEAWEANRERAATARRSQLNEAWGSFGSALLRRVGLLVSDVNSAWLRGGVLTHPQPWTILNQHLLPAKLEKLLSVPCLGIDDAVAGDPISAFRSLVPKRVDEHSPSGMQRRQSHYAHFRRDALILEEIELLCDDPDQIAWEGLSELPVEFDDPEVIKVSVVPGTLDVDLIETTHGTDLIQASVHTKLEIADYVPREVWLDAPDELQLYDEPELDDGYVRVYVRCTADLYFDIEVHHSTAAGVTAASAEFSHLEVLWRD
ncbi:MAG TPA: hypothetical protein VFC19_02445 [Candidatus Limnocylindrales bacterium]|nr:hypothetical protein [Candidatus Limnocylindrales bacterium]